MVFVAGCREEPRTPQTDISDPRARVAQLLAAREAGDRGTLRSLIVPEQADVTVAFLDAVDDYLAENTRLRTHLREHVGSRFALAIEQDQLRENLGLFSVQVRVLDVDIADDEATVTYTANGRLPVKRATLRLVDGTWYYDPGEQIEPEATDAFRSMAQGVRYLLTDLETGNITAAELRQDPAMLARELRLRLADGISRLPAPDSAPPLPSSE